MPPILFLHIKTHFLWSAALLLFAIGCQSGQQNPFSNPFMSPDRVPAQATRSIIPGQAQPYYPGDPVPVLQGAVQSGTQQPVVMQPPSNFPQVPPQVQPVSLSPPNTVSSQPIQSSQHNFVDSGFTQPGLPAAAAPQPASFAQVPNQTQPMTGSNVSSVAPTAWRSPGGKNYNAPTANALAPGAPIQPAPTTAPRVRFPTGVSPSGVQPVSYTAPMTPSVPQTVRITTLPPGSQQAAPIGTGGWQIPATTAPQVAPTGSLQNDGFRPRSSFR